MSGDAQKPGCLGIGLMAFGLTAFAIGILLWGASSMAQSNTPTLLVAITVLGAALFVAGTALEIRERLVRRRP